MSLNRAEEIAKELPEGNRVILGGVVGSYNYGLDDGLSDKDIRYYVMPTLDDLVRGRKKRRIFLDHNADIQIHDLRRLEYFLQMGDLNQISVLFSDEQYINHEYDDLLLPLLTNREQIASGISRYIYMWGRSMFEKKMGQLTVFKENENIYRDNGYNTKVACQAIYHIKMISKYLYNLEYNVKEPLKNALDCSDIKEYIRDIKKGEYSYDEFMKIADAEWQKYNSVNGELPGTAERWVTTLMYDTIKKAMNRKGLVM